jgi:hypothetical protein
MELTEIEDLFPSDKKEIYKMLNEMGFDLEALEKEFDNYSPKKPLNYKVISEDAIEPKYAYESDSGFDLYSTVDMTLKPFEELYYQQDWYLIYQIHLKFK